jgi:predicted Zn-dependent protease/Tfp pilus assembly protein PilF
MLFSAAWMFNRFYSLWRTRMIWALLSGLPMITMLLVSVPVKAATHIVSQSESLSQRAGHYLQQGQLELAEQLARDGLIQATHAEDKVRATIILALVQAKQGKRESAIKALKLLETQYPPTSVLGGKIQKALSTVQHLPAASTEPKASAAKSSTSATASDYFNYAITPGQVVHWNLARMPLRVYVTPHEGAKTLFGNTEYLVMTAISEWRKAEPRLRFTLVSREAESDIRVRWERTLQHNRIGESPSYMVGKRLVLADLVLATHHANGQPLPKALLYHTIVHEFGHVLGIHGHSPYTDDIMYWQATPRQGSLTQRDMNTLKRLYATPANYTNDVAQSLAAARLETAQLMKAQQLLEGGNPQEALTLLESILKRSPAYYDANLLAAMAHTQLKNYPVAISYYEAALAQDGSDPRVKFNLALVYVKRGEQETAGPAAMQGWYTKAMTLFSGIQQELEGNEAQSVAQALQHCHEKLDAISSLMANQRD